MTTVELDHAIGLSGGVPSGLHVSSDGDTFFTAVGATAVVSQLRDLSNQSFLRGTGQVCALTLSQSVSSLTCAVFQPLPSHPCPTFIDVQGNLLATGHAGTSAAVVVWDVARRDARFRLEEHEGRVTALAFSDDDRVLLSAATDCSIVFWDLVTGGVIARRQSEQSPTLAFAPAGFVADVKGRDTALYQFVSAGCKSASAWGLDPATGAAASERLTAPGMLRDYICVACSSAGGSQRQWVYLGTANGDICVVHIGSRTIAASVFVGGGGVCSLRVLGSKAGGTILLAAGCSDGSVLIYRHVPPTADATGRLVGGALSAATPHVAGAIASRMGVGTGEGRVSTAALGPATSVSIPRGGAVWGIAPLACTERSVGFLAATANGAIYSITGSMAPDASAPAPLSASSYAPAPAFGRRGGSANRSDSIFGGPTPTGAFTTASAPASATDTAPGYASARGAERGGGGLMVARLVLQAHGAGREGLGGAESLPSALTLGTSGGMGAVEGLPPAIAASLRPCDVLAVAFAPGLSDRFVTAANDNTVRVWDAHSLQCSNEVSVRDAGHPICAAFVTADFTVSGWQDGAIRAHMSAQGVSGSPPSAAEAPLPLSRTREGGGFGGGRPGALESGPGGSSRRGFGGAGGAGATPDPALLWTLPDAHSGRSGGVSCLAPAYNQRFFVSGGGDGAVRVWDARR
jgi:WD40 repeat protein